MKKLITIVIFLVFFELLGIADASDRKLRNEDKTSILATSIEELKVLVNNGLDINSINLYGGNLVSYIAFSESTESLEKWIKLGADVDKKNDNGTTPLNFAIAGNNVRVVEFLVKHGVSIDHKNLHGSTPLHYAITGLYSLSPKIPIILIEAGADVNTLDGKGNSPLYKLRKQKQYGWGAYEEKIEQMLISRGAKEISLFSEVSSKLPAKQDTRMSIDSQQYRFSEQNRRDKLKCGIEVQLEEDKKCELRK